MDTRKQASSFVEKKNFPYWKLYRGSNRIAVCGARENPDADSETATYLFNEELETIAMPGNYSVNTFGVVNGDKSGSKFEFIIEKEPVNSRFQSRPVSSSMGFDPTIIQFIETQLLNKQANERIEKKLDALLEAVMIMSDGDKDNDEDIKKIIMPLVANFITKAKTGAAAASAVKTGAFN